MATFQEVANKITTQKEGMKDALAVKGVTLTAPYNFETIKNGILSIEQGAGGDFDSDPVEVKLNIPCNVFITEEEIKSTDVFGCVINPEKTFIEDSTLGGDFGMARKYAIALSGTGEYLALGLGDTGADLLAVHKMVNGSYVNLNYDGIKYSSTTGYFRNTLQISKDGTAIAGTLNCSPYRLAFYRREGDVITDITDLDEPLINEVGVSVVPIISNDGKYIISGGKTANKIVVWTYNEATKRYDGELVDFPDTGYFNSKMFAMIDNKTLCACYYSTVSVLDLQTKVIKTATASGGSTFGFAKDNFFYKVYGNTLEIFGFVSGEWVKVDTKPSCNFASSVSKVFIQDHLVFQTPTSGTSITVTNLATGKSFYAQSVMSGFADASYNETGTMVAFISGTAVGFKKPSCYGKKVKSVVGGKYKFHTKSSEAGKFGDTVTMPII